MLDNKLGITNEIELAKEEKISNNKALELFTTGYLNTLIPGTYES